MKACNRWICRSLRDVRTDGQDVGRLAHDGNGRLLARGLRRVEGLLEGHVRTHRCLPSPGRCLVVAVPATQAWCLKLSPLAPYRVPLSHEAAPVHAGARHRRDSLPLCSSAGTDVAPAPQRQCNDQHQQGRKEKPDERPWNLGRERSGVQRLVEGGEPRQRLSSSTKTPATNSR
jgi:hypothetical protein